jgi:hypothetical protein
MKQKSYKWLDTRKRRLAKLSKKTHPQKALGGVAHFLRNSAFNLIKEGSRPFGVEATSQRTILSGLIVFERGKSPVWN